MVAVSLKKKNFFQAEDGIRDTSVTGVQTCALPILMVGLVEMPAFIVTLATMLMYRSFAQYFCQHVDKVLIGNGSSVYKMANDKSSYQMFYNMGNGKAASIPYVGIVLYLAVVLLSPLLLAGSVGDGVEVAAICLRLCMVAQRS